MSAFLPHIERAFQAIAILGTGTVTGAMLVVSSAAIPVILKSPFPTSSQQFHALIDNVKVIASTLTLSSTLAFAALAYSFYHHQGEVESTPLYSPSLAYSLAALATFSGLPFTVLVMRGSYTELSKIETSGKADKASELAEKLKRWSNLNYMRLLLPLSGTILGVYGTAISA